jgi:FMN phosphatase YigB (HAD superfamily)
MNAIIFFDIDYTLIDTDVLRQHTHSLPKEIELAEAKLPFKEAVYPETIPTLDSLSDGYTLGILSQADHSKEFQLAKLTSGEIVNYFDRDWIFIGPSKRDLINGVNLQLNEKSINEPPIFIDDRIDHLELIAAGIPNVITYHVRRGKYKNIEAKYIPNHEIRDLSELSKFF